MTENQFSLMPKAMLVSLQADIKRNQQQTSPIVRLDKNSHGRDFIVGDIHGAFSLVRSAMRKVKFDKSKDRLFSCGDLVDRGKESPAALRFLAASFVHAIMGNHENELVQIYAGLDPEDDQAETLVQTLARMNWNGMAWLMETTPDQRASLVRAFSKLPLAMEVDTPRGLAGIVHGEVPIGMDWPTFRVGILAGDPAIKESCLTGRTRAKAFDQTMVNGVGRLYCGHTPQFDGAVRMGNVFFIDSGAVFSQIETTSKNHPNAALTMAGMCFATTDLSNIPIPDDAAPVHLLGRSPGVGPFNSSWLEKAP